LEKILFQDKVQKYNSSRAVFFGIQGTKIVYFCDQVQILKDNFTTAGCQFLITLRTNGIQYINAKRTSPGGRF